MAKMPATPQNAEVRQYDLSSSETFGYGALVMLDGSQEVTEVGADPGSVLGIALKPGDEDLPFSDKVLVALAREGAKFELDGDSDPEASDVDTDYGAAKDGDGIWHVDTTDETNLVFHVVDVDLDRNRYLVQFVEAARQVAP